MVYANFDSQEGSVSGTATVTLTWKSRRLIITNDASNDLQFKFHSSETFGTLKPTETISLDIQTTEVFLSGNGAYRIWSYG